MTSSQLDQLTRSLARGGPRRWALKTLAAGALGVGVLARGTRSSAALSDEDYQVCLRACLTTCTPGGGYIPPRCPSQATCEAQCAPALL
jgi:hypothetical protein